MQSAFGNYDFTQLSPAERLLIAQELLDSVYDDVTPRRGRFPATANPASASHAINTPPVPSTVEPLRIRAAG